MYYIHPSTPQTSAPHYYGDIVRKLLFSAAILMLFGLPFFSERLPVSLSGSLVVIIAVGFFAGLTNPIKSWTIFIDMVVSILATIIFEYYAVVNYQTNSGADWLFWIDQILALIFLFALYYSTKTVRAMFLQRQTHDL